MYFKKFILEILRFFLNFSRVFTAVCQKEGKGEDFVNIYIFMILFLILHMYVNTFM